MGTDRDTDKRQVEAIASIAYALRALGNADAATPMGAIEALGAAIIKSADRIASAIDEPANWYELPDAVSRLGHDMRESAELIRQGLLAIAEALRYRGMEE